MNSHIFGKAFDEDRQSQNILGIPVGHQNNVVFLLCLIICLLCIQRPLFGKKSLESSFTCWGLGRIYRLGREPEDEIY